ncbi:hypothetical protein [Carp edema virus]|nr:hypothetical protein [Carp edema virus]
MKIKRNKYLFAFKALLTTSKMETYNLVISSELGDDSVMTHLSHSSDFEPILKSTKISDSEFELQCLGENSHVGAKTIDVTKTKFPSSDLPELMRDLTSWDSCVLVKCQMNPDDPNDTIFRILQSYAGCNVIYNDNSYLSLLRFMKSDRSDFPAGRLVELELKFYEFRYGVELREFFKNSATAFYKYKYCTFAGFDCKECYRVSEKNEFCVCLAKDYSCYVCWKKLEKVSEHRRQLLEIPPKIVVTFDPELKTYHSDTSPSCWIINNDDEKMSKPVTWNEAMEEFDRVMAANKNRFDQNCTD